MSGYDLTSAAPAPRRRAGLLELLADRRIVVFLLGALPVVALGAANGGYYEGSWNWASLVLLWLAGATLIARQEASLSWQSLAAGALMVAVLGWTLASELWTSDHTATWLASQRQLVYAATVIAGVVVVRRSTVPALLGGIWVGIVLVCGWGLLTRVLPDRLGVIEPIAQNRLSDPIGYWNSFGLLAAFGILLALGLAARSRNLWLRCLAAASLPVLATALYFTFSRGAWLALGIGLVVAVVADRAPLQLGSFAVVLGVAPGIAVALAATKSALDSTSTNLSAEAAPGHRLALEILALLAANAVVAVVLTATERRTRLEGNARRGVQTFFVALVLVAAVIGIVRFGSPWTVGSKVWHSFASQPTNPGTNLNNRLFHLSSSGRVTQWKVAWRQYQEHRVLGGGAGTWGAYWAQHRPHPGTVKNVHNLYLEELSELGPIGLALLVAALAVPLLGLLRARREPLAAVALGAYVAFLAHAAVDWDWQLLAVSLPAVLCGVALIVCARRERASRSVAVRAPLLGIVVLLLCGALYAGVARVAVSRIDSAAATGDWSAAVTRTRRASDLEPWSSEPWKHLADAALAAHQRSLARQAYLQAIRHSPNQWRLWLGLGESSTGAFRFAGYARALQLAPLEPELQAAVRN